MKKFTYLLGAFLMIGGISHAQDIHFSAMDYSPLTLNPALAGANNDLTATINYRNQWKSVASPFTTIAAGADMRVTGRGYNSKGSLAVGINFFNDKAGSNKMTTNRFGLTAAYQLKLADGHSLGLGIQGDYGSRSLEMNDARWGNQYNGMEYDPSIPGEEMGTPKFSYFDVNAGLVYTYHPRNVSQSNNGTTVNVGLSAYHLNQPKWSFIQSESEKLHIRMSAFAMAKIGIGDKNMAIEPQVIAQFQGPQIEFILGTDYRIFFGQSTMDTPKTSIALGMFWRNRDAIMTRFSVNFYGVDIGAIYDFNIFNDLKSISHSKGAFELFLRYGLNFSGNGGSRAMF